MVERTLAHLLVDHPIKSSVALLIVTLTSAIVGLIISFLGAVVLERFGGGCYVSYPVSYGILRELAGLRAKLQLQSFVTGQLYVELTFVSDTDPVELAELPRPMLDSGLEAMAAEIEASLTTLR